MKKSIFALLSLSILLSACQSAPQMQLSAFNPGLASPQLRSASASRTAAPRSTGYSGLEDFRSYLADKLFAALDQNGDQTLVPTEMNRLLNKESVGKFAQLDINGDGRVALAEFQTRKDLVFSDRYSVKTLTEKLTTFFQSQDLNHDNFVSYEESKGNLNLLFDYDHDNRFALNEFIDATSQLLRLAPTKTEEFLKAHLG
jgi:hypothetical protein